MILPLEQQVAPLVESQRLKELGMPQDTLFYWDGTGLLFCYENTPFCYVPSKRALLLDVDLALPFTAAPTIAELGELLLLPRAYHDTRLYDFPKPFYHGDGRQTWGTLDAVIEDSATEVEARARLLIALAERGVVRFEEMPDRMSEPPKEEG